MFDKLNAAEFERALKDGEVRVGGTPAPGAEREDEDDKAERAKLGKYPTRVYADIAVSYRSTSLREEAPRHGTLYYIIYLLEAKKREGKCMKKAVNQVSLVRYYARVILLLITIIGWRSCIRGPLQVLQDGVKAG